MDVWDEKKLCKPKLYFQKQLKTPIEGISLTSAKGGDTVEVAIRGYFTTFDGDIFYNTIEHLSSIFLHPELVQNGMLEQDVKNVLIFIDKNNLATIHINFSTIAKIMVKHEQAKLTPLFSDNITDVIAIEFPGIEMKEEDSVIYLFSSRWRKGLFFNFVSNSAKNTNIGNLATLFASCHMYLLYPEIHRLDEEVKGRMYKSGWFPFIRILGRHRILLDAFRNNFPIENAETQLVAQFNKDVIGEMKELWMKKEVFRVHSEFITKGVDEYLEGDYISAISILYPRIEGLMRHLYVEKDKPTSEELRKKINEIGKKKSKEFSMFLPDEFNAYLKCFYFSSFSLKNGELHLSRHSVSHGVAEKNDFSQIKAFQAILILDQIYFYL